MNAHILSLCLALWASLGLAQEAVMPTRAERAAIVETLQRGKQITVRNERYELLPEVLAVERKSREEPPGETLAPLGAGAAQIIETKGKLVLFRSVPKEGAYVEQIGRTTVYPAVLNSRSRAFGVLTGTVVVKPANMADAAGIANRYGLASVKEYPHLGTVLYRVKANVDIVDLVAVLRADPRIESAYPEIIEHVRVPK